MTSASLSFASVLAQVADGDTENESRATTDQHERDVPPRGGGGLQFLSRMTNASGEVLGVNTLGHAEHEGVNVAISWQAIRDDLLSAGVVLFTADLRAKSHVVLLEAEHQVVGFSSLVVSASEGVAGEPIQVVYSGDTIVDRAHWGSSVLFTSWMKGLSTIGAYGEGQTSYWLLLASGARTYRMLLAFWQTYVPRAADKNVALSGLAARLATERFGRAFDAHLGIVRPENAYALRPEMMPSVTVRSNEHVRYFYERNPGHARGDELVCLAELAPSNLSRLGARMAAAT